MSTSKPDSCDGEHAITELLVQWSDGDPEALEKVSYLVFEELRRLARMCFAREPQGHTLQPTALVNELFVRLLGRRRVKWENRAQFFKGATEIMRHILVDQARKRQSRKRGGNVSKEPLDGATIPLPVAYDEDVLALHQALDRLDGQRRRIVELRFYFGLTHGQIGEVLGLSPDTVKEKWAATKVRLHRQLEGTSA